jgi:hypothetical protein
VPNRDSSDWRCHGLLIFSACSSVAIECFFVSRSCIPHLPFKSHTHELDLPVHNSRNLPRPHFSTVCLQLLPSLVSPSVLLLCAILKSCAGRMAGVEHTTDNVQAEIADVAKSMKLMEDEIKDVAAESKQATEQWKNCSPEDKEFWRQKEARLGSEKAALRAQLGRMQEMLMQHRLNLTQHGTRLLSSLDWILHSAPHSATLLP